MNFIAIFALLSILTLFSVDSLIINVKLTILNDNCYVGNLIMCMSIIIFIVNTMYLILTKVAIPIIIVAIQRRDQGLGRYRGSETGFELRPYKLQFISDSNQLCVLLSSVPTNNKFGQILALLSDHRPNITDYMNVRILM